MQLNMGGLRLNTLFLYDIFHLLLLYFLFFFFNFPSFCSLYFFFFYFLLQPMLILNRLSWCHKFQLHFMSLMPQVKERSSRLSILKWSHAHLKRRLQEFVAVISHNTSFTHCPILLVTELSPPIFGLQHCCRFRKRMQLNMGGLRLNTFFLSTFSIFFFFTPFSFSSIVLPSTVYISSFSIFSFSLCWSLLAWLGVINFNFISCPSCLK